jgi:phage terminase small subunit
MSKDDKLTDREEIFCYEYALSFNKTKSYYTAYPNTKSDNTAAVSGGRLYKKPKIQRRIKELQADIAKTSEISRLRVVKEHERKAFRTMADYYNDWGVLKPWDEITEDEKAGISEIVTRIRKISSDNGDELGEIEEIKLKLHDSNKHLENISKMLGYNEPEKIEHSGEVENKTTILVQDQRTARNVDLIINDND